MTGLYFLNGLDMYTTYGFCPSVRCSDDFLKMRKRKAVYVNNWEEEDGMEYDLSSPPKYEDREIKLIGFIKASDTSDLWNKYNALKNVFNTMSIINIECKEYNANELVKCFYKSTNVFEIYKDKVGENVAYCNIEIALQEVQSYTPPVGSIPVPTLTANDTANTLSASVSGGYTIQYRENGGAWSTYSSTINVGDVDRAAGYYEFRATDGTSYSSIIGSPAFTQAVVVDCDPEWDNVISLLRGNGTDGSTTITDEKSITWTKTGNVAVSTAQSKWGGSSLYFDGTGYLKRILSTAITADYTIEGWFYFNTYSLQYVFGEYVNSSSVGLYIQNEWTISLATNGAENNSSHGIALNTWVHIAVVRTATHIKLYIDGVEKNSVANSTTPNIQVMYIASVEWIEQAPHFNGYIDDFRITRAARYTANFTPPTAQFPNVGCSGG